MGDDRAAVPPHRLGIRDTPGHMMDPTLAASGLRIRDVVAHPLEVRVAQPSRAESSGAATLALVVVEVLTDAGITGVGEVFARKQPRRYADAVHAVLRPVLIGHAVSPLDVCGARLREAADSGGVPIECLAGVDIALWDIAGKAASRPVADMLGGKGKLRLQAYASCVDLVDEGRATEEIHALLSRGFRQIKVKLAPPLDAATRRALFFRRLVGPSIALAADANGSFDVDEALRLAPVLRDLGYMWFEEPLPTSLIAGYRALRDAGGPIIAAGEGDFGLEDSALPVSERLFGIVQPNVTRAGGLTGTRRIVEHAAAHGAHYVPHIGWSGAVGLAASLHLSAAAPNFLTFECRTFPNPLRECLGVSAHGDHELIADGCLPVPQGCGLGIELDRDAIARYRAT